MSEHTEQLVRDVVLRALATLREWNVLPSVDLPQITLVPLESGRGYETRVAIEIAESAEAAGLDHASADALALKLANYLSETVDLVPAYNAIRSVEPASGGALHILMRDS